MSFLAMMIALVLLQAWGAGSRVQFDGWFDSLRTRINHWGLPEGLRLVLLILLPVVVAQFALGAVEPLLFGLPWIALAAFLLLYSLGRGNFRELLERYQGQCRNEDFEAAFLTTMTRLSCHPGEEDPVSAADVHALVQRGFFYEGYQRFFAVLFYFVLLGPAGALAYRLLHLYRETGEVALADRCLFIVDWLPTRLLAATFTLTGDFVGSRDELLEAMVDVNTEAPEVLQTVGEAALDFDESTTDLQGGQGLIAAEQNHELGGLLFRSAACWVAAISLLVLLL